MKIIPTIEVSCCDYCNKIIRNRKEQFIIYKISFWNKKEFMETTIDFLFDNDIAKIFCSAICIGLYFEKLINGN